MRKVFGKHGKVAAFAVAFAIAIPYLIIGQVPPVPARKPPLPVPAPNSLTLQLNRLALTNVQDAAGLWQFEGGQVREGGREVANYASSKRVVFKGTDQNDQNSAMVTTTILFLGSSPPENITLQGVHRFNAGDEIGSVSAASPMYAGYIGQSYSKYGATNVINIPAAFR